MEKKTKKSGSSSKTGSAGMRGMKSGSDYRSNGVSGLRTSRSKSNGSKSSSSASVSSEEGESRGHMLEEFFVDQLKDIYWAEKALVKALTKMAKEATSEDLQQAFEDHRVETEGQVARLEEAFEMLGKRVQGKKCEAMQGMIEEAEEGIKETEDDTFTRDVALIVSAQKVEHYEIASYGCLVQLARTLGKEDVAELLEETLEEEKKCDELLTSIAESHVNEQAIAE